MSEYSIKDLERYSGIKAGTLRIWESRYNLLSPLRSETNIRTYSNEDLRHIMNVSFLNSRGYKISKIAELTPQQIHKKVIDIAETQIVPDIQVESLFRSMTGYNDELFNNTFTKCVEIIGFEKTMTEVIYPFLRKLGIMWHAGAVSPGEEHFIMQLIRQKLIVAIDRTDSIKKDQSQSFILYLPEDEFHELALLYYNYWLRANGYTTYYLGQSVPHEDIKKAYNQLLPTCLFTVITCPKEELPVEDFLKTLSKDFPKATIYISGSQDLLSSIKPLANTFLIKDPKGLSKLLEKTA